MSERWKRERTAGLGAQPEPLQPLNIANEMSTFVRCSSGNTGPAWTCVLPVGHDGDHIYSLWSEIAAMAETEIRQAEAKIQRVRELCEQTTVSVSIGCRCYTDECSGTCGAGRPLSWHLNPAAVLAALDGEQ